MRFQSSGATIPQPPSRRRMPCYNAGPMRLKVLSKSTKQRAIALVLAIALALLIALPAAAHATLVRSEPAAGALLDTSPPSLSLEFSEELDPAFSQAQLFDSQNRLIEPGPGEIAPSAPRVLRLILPDLPKGSYTALWRVRSIVDGHITEGSLPFGVGVAPTSTSLIPPLGAPDPATPSPPPLATLARWLNLVAVVLALGGLPFGLLVWRPAFRRASTDDRPPITEDSGDRGLAIGDQETSIPNRQSPIANRSLEVADDAITHFIRRTTALGGLLFVLTNLLFLITQAAEAANVPLAQAIGAPAIQLLSGQTGLLWLARLALMLQVVVLVWRLPPSGRGPAGMWWALLAIGGVIVLTLSLRSHAAASQAAAIAVPVDWLHLAATIAWLGGLIPLAF